MRISVADARKTLPKLIKAVEDAEPVTIRRRGVPIVDIVRTQRQRVFGSLKGKLEIVDPACWKPVTYDQLEAWVVRAKLSYLSSKAR